MSEVFLYNINNWTSDDVESWIRGISSHLSEYLPFDNASCDGKWLINLSLSDLKSVGIVKIGHCIILMDAIRILIDELHQMNNETLQNVIYRVSCDATSLINYIDKYLRLNESLDHFLQNHVSPFYETETEAYNCKQLYPGQLDEIQSIKMIIISSVLKLTNSILVSLEWLKKPNFMALPELIEMKIGLLDDLKRINRFTQYVVSDKGEEKFADMKGISNMIRYRTQTFIDNCRDSLYLTPCIIDTVQIHKTENVVFGINVKTVLGNLHIIESIDINSPAYSIGKLEEGDELLEINNQIIIGWCHQSVIEEIRSHPRKLCLRLRKKPMHVNESINSGGRRQRNVPQNPVNAGHIRGGVLTRPSKRINQAGMLGSVSTPATPVLLSKNVHINTGNSELLKQSNEIANEVLRKLQLENPNLDINKNEELGSESEYSAADASPYVSRHKIKNQKDSTMKDDVGAPYPFRKPIIDTFTALSEEDDVKSEFGSGEIYPRRFLPNDHDSMDEINTLKVEKPSNDDALSPTQSGRDTKSDSTNQRRTFNKQNSFFELGKYDCEGWLAFKTVDRLTHSYLRRWCVLQNKVLSIFSKKDEIKEDINIEVCEIIRRKGRHASYLSFQVRNSFMEYSFQSYNQADYEKWLDKLKLNSERESHPQSHWIRNYHRSQRLSLTRESEEILCFDKVPIDEIEDVYDSTIDENSNHVLENQISISSSERFSSRSPTSGASTSIQDSFTYSEDSNEYSLINNLAKMKVLEREIRDKSLFLGKIDDVLQFSGNSDAIDLFYEENQDNLQKYV